MRSTPGIAPSSPTFQTLQDDIVVATANKETRFQTLKVVITALEKAGLTISLSKCILGQPEILFWGYKINKNGIKPDPKRKDNPADFINQHAIPLQKLPQRIAEETKEYQKLLFLLHPTAPLIRECLRVAQLNNTDLT